MSNPSSAFSENIHVEKAIMGHPQLKAFLELGHQLCKTLQVQEGHPEPSITTIRSSMKHIGSLNTMRWRPQEEREVLENARTASHSIRPPALTMEIELLSNHPAGALAAIQEVVQGAQVQFQAKTGEKHEVVLVKGEEGGLMVTITPSRYSRGQYSSQVTWVLGSPEVVDDFLSRFFDHFIRRNAARLLEDIPEIQVCPGNVPYEWRVLEALMKMSPPIKAFVQQGRLERQWATPNTNEDPEHPSKKLRL